MGFEYVLLIRIRRPYISNWDRSAAGPWDKTVGSSAEVAGWLDELETELARHHGFEVGGGLLDLRKFYDQVAIPDLIEASKALRYPLRLLVLAMDAYLGVRMLTSSGAVHSGILPHGGILPGCGQAVSQARAYLHEPMKSAALSVSGLSLREWVDDISFRLFGTHASI